MTQERKRPVGMVILGLLLGWLSIAGVANALVIFSSEMPPLGTGFGILALVYAATAMAACIGLLAMKPWGLKALHSWMLVCLVLFVTFALQFEDFILGGVMGLLGFGVFVGLLFMGMHRYVSARLATESQA